MNDDKERTTEAQRILPCPFCGNWEFHRMTYEEEHHAVRCYQCHFYGPPKKEREGAIAAWNMRVPLIEEKEPFGWLYKLVDECQAESLEVKKEALLVLLGQYWFLSREFHDPSPVNIRKWSAPILREILKELIAGYPFFNSSEDRCMERLAQIIEQKIKGP